MGSLPFLANTLTTHRGSAG